MRWVTAAVTLPLMLGTDLACSGSSATSNPSAGTGGGSGSSGGALGAAAGGGTSAGGSVSLGAGGAAVTAGGGGSLAAGGGTGVSGSPNGTGGVKAGTGGTNADGGQPASGWWKPAPGTSWQWQLSGKLDSSFDVSVYDIDLVETTTADITALHAKGRNVVCYFDTAYEPGRPDSASLEPYRGNPVDGWPGQFWLDIRKPEVVTVMLARLDVAQSKHCDGVEADDVDSRSNDPGFPITKADQEAFIRKLSTEAHARGLSFGLKNDLDEIPDLLDSADFAVNEECFQYSECGALKPFITAGKAVFQVEYTDGDLAAKGASICPGANSSNFDTLIKHLDLGPPRFACR
jgi:hypothetical protein